MKITVTSGSKGIFIVWAEVALTFEIGRKYGMQVQNSHGLSAVGEITEDQFHWYAWADMLTFEEKQVIRQRTSKEQIALLLVTHRLKA